MGLYACAACFKRYELTISQMSFHSHGSCEICGHLREHWEQVPVQFTNDVTRDLQWGSVADQLRARGKDLGDGMPAPKPQIFTSDELFRLRGELEQVSISLETGKPMTVAEVRKKVDAIADRVFQRYLDVLGHEMRAARRSA